MLFRLQLLVSFSSPVTFQFTMSAGSGENRLRPIIIGFNVLIYAMFIALLALFFAIPDSVVEVPRHHFLLEVLS